MPRPTIKITKTSIPPKITTVEAAQGAVKKFEDERDLLVQMQQNFQENFPDAWIALQDIRTQEDVVSEAIAFAHPLVQAAKQSVGEFDCQRKWKQAHYDDKEFVGLIVALDDDEAQVILDLFKGGYIKSIKLDKSATAYFATHQEESKHFQEAWKKKTEQTPAVTTPKI